MADQPFDKRTAGGRVGIPAAAQRVGIARSARKSAWAVSAVRSHVGVDVVVVTIKHVEAAPQPRIGDAENQKIMQILDLVVRAELRQQKCTRGTNWRGNSAGDSAPSRNCASIA